MDAAGEQPSGYGMSTVTRRPVGRHRPVRAAVLLGLLVVALPGLPIEALRLTAATSAGSSSGTLAPGGQGSPSRSAPGGASEGEVVSPAVVSVAASPSSLTVARGASATFAIALGRSGDGQLPINLAVDGLPGGTSAKFGPNPAWLTTATLTISTSECGTATPIGTYPLTITAWANADLFTTTVSLRVNDGPPRATAPRSEIDSGHKLDGESKVRTVWSACDADAIQWYRADRQGANDWRTVATGSATSVTHWLPLNKTRRYRAMAGEASFPAGGAFAYGPGFQPRLAQESSVAFSGSWTAVDSKKYWGGKARYATARGAAATYSFTGSSVGWLSLKGPTRGAAQVYVDGALVKTVDLRASELKPRRVVFAHSWPSAGRHTIRVVVLGTSGRPRVDVDGFVTLVNTSSYVKNTWNGRFTTQRPSDITCVAASSLTWTNYASGTTSAEYYSSAIAAEWYREVRTANQNFHNKYDYSGIEPGLDPRGWAWLLWRHAAPGRGYHDYWSSSQGAVNNWMVWNIREASEPAGALIFRSVHAVNVVGFSSNIDPRNGAYTLNGFFIVDPWYPAGPTAMNDGGTLGLAPNTFITLSTWNRSYFLPYVDKPYEAVHGPNLWHRQYVAVLRSADGTPEPTASFDAMPPTYSGVGPAAAAPAPASPVEPAFAEDDALGAVSAGIAANGLTGDARLGLDDAEIELGGRVDVESLSEDMPPYSLVEVVQGGRVVAVAMLTRGAEGLRFAGIQGAGPGNELLDATKARGTLRAQGVDVRSMRAVWRPSPDSMAPFSPFWAARDAHGRDRFLTPSGIVKPAIEPAVGR